MPAQLIHAVCVATECVVFRLPQKYARQINVITSISISVVVFGITIMPIVLLYFYGLDIVLKVNV